jgi:hypothetical protein
LHSGESKERPDFKHEESEKIILLTTICVRSATERGDGEEEEEERKTEEGK